MAPGDRPAQRSLALRQVAGAAAEVEAPAEAFEDHRRAEDPDPGRCQLDRQGQSAEPIRDLADRGEGVVTEHEVRPMDPRPVDEQAHAGRDVQRRHGVPALPADPQQLPARRQYPQVRRVSNDPGDDLRALGQELLQVVQDEQRRSFAEEGPQRGINRHVRRFAHPERGCNR